MKKSILSLLLIMTCFVPEMEARRKIPGARCQSCCGSSCGGCSSKSHSKKNKKNKHQKNKHQKNKKRCSSCNKRSCCCG